MNNAPPSRAALLRAIARIERTTLGRAAPTEVAALGHAGIDAALGGGLMRGRVHELFAAEPGDSSSAAGFAAMLARALGGGVVWLRQEGVEGRGGALDPAGLAGIGLDPGALVLVAPPDPERLLAAAADVVRCPEVGVAVIELWREPRALDLTAGRRLTLAAEASGVTTLMLRIDAAPAPSGAQTRWEVRAAASAPIDDAPGLPALDLTLVRQRGRPAGGRWIVEWNGDEGRLRDRSDASGGAATLSGDRAADAAYRPAAVGARGA